MKKMEKKIKKNEFEQKIKHLQAVGVRIPEESGAFYEEELKGFLNGTDFLKLGQAINRGQWESAMMCVRRMQQKAQHLGLAGLERPLMGIRQTIVHKNATEAKQLMAILTQKRVQLRNILSGQK